MQRIGLAASKIAKGNFWLYHLAVVAIAFLFGMFVFLVCGFSIAAMLLIISIVSQYLIPGFKQQTWMDLIGICLISLAGLIGLVVLIAIIKNIKLKSNI